MNKRVNISLPTTILEKLKTEIPEGKRSKFIAESLEKNLLKRISLKESITRDLKENRWIHESTMKDWSNLETTNWPEI